MEEAKEKKEVLRKVDNPFKFITKLVAKRLDRGNFINWRDENDLDTFLRLICLLGEKEVNAWVEAWTSDCKSYENIAYSLQKSLRQVDVFSVSVSKRMSKKEIEGIDLVNNHGSEFAKSRSVEVESGEEYRNGDIRVRLFFNGHLDMMLRHSLQSQAVWDLLKRVFIVSEDDIWDGEEF